MYHVDLGESRGMLPRKCFLEIAARIRDLIRMVGSSPSGKSTIFYAMISVQLLHTNHCCFVGLLDVYFTSCLLDSRHSLLTVLFS